MDTSPLGIGIDVSKATLDVVLRFSLCDEHFIVRNDAEGITQLGDRLRDCTCHIILESTGRYHLLAAFLLSQQGLDVRVINPLDARRYITASVRKHKTDKADATVLAHIAAVERRLPRRFSASKLDIQIRQKMGLVCSLEKHLQSLKATLTTYHSFQDIMDLPQSATEHALEQTAHALKQQKESLQTEIEAAALQTTLQQERVLLATSIPGISPFVAVLLCQMLSSDCQSAKQWIAFLGLDISLHQSGTWKGNGKLSKRGNAYLRKRLFMAAWGAILHYKQFHTYYEKLRSEGRSYREAVVIVERKLLRILFAVLRKGVPFSEQDCVFS